MDLGMLPANWLLILLINRRNVVVSIGKGATTRKERKGGLLSKPQRVLWVKMELKAFTI